MGNTHNDRSETIIVGLGVTGLSVARYLHARGENFVVADTRESPLGLSELRETMPSIPVLLGDLDRDRLCQAARLIVSPGVGLRTPAIHAARQTGVEITGDIQIFSQEAKRPIIAVSGSNGKSTVVALTGAILRAAGLNVAIGGNLDSSQGMPALDLFNQAEPDFFLLEVSSFQLETTDRLNAEVATVLNLSADHMDRYDSLEEYHRAKLRIYRGCRQAVVNSDSPYSRPLDCQDIKLWEFGFHNPQINAVSLLEEREKQYLVHQFERIVATDELKIVGQHNIANAMAAIALGAAAGVEIEPMRQALIRFPGLPHRCQWVAQIEGVDFYNDSKGTNVGAAVAAIEGLGQRIKGQLLLIAGGVAKSADFQPLAAAVKRWAREIILIGQDALEIAGCLDSGLRTHFAAHLEEAVSVAFSSARPGDAVLLSPACASFDMFDNFEHRGRVFTAAVEALQ